MAPRSPVPAASLTGGSRRRAILDIGTVLFAANGYHGTSVRDIAVACDLQPASLYSHFKNKEEILHAILMPYLTALVPALAAVANDDGDGRERLGLLVDRAVALGYAHRSQFIILSNDWNHIQRTPGLSAVVDSTRRCERIWRKVLADGVADGSIRADVRVAHALRVVFGAVAGLVDDRYDDLGSGKPRGGATIGTIILDGLGTGGS
jgi:TetR/AcrR family transcriptional regulator, cholesterol catabolism regulator